MSSYEEHSRGATPLPASAEFAREEGMRFTEANKKFRQLIESVGLRPSKLALKAVDEQRGVASESAGQIEEELFFRATGDEQLIRAAVGIVLHETEQNWHLTTKVDPDDPSPEGFPEGLRELLVAKLMEEEEDTDFSFMGMEIDMDDIETLGELPAETLTLLVCSAHEESVEDLYRSFMASGEVIEHEVEQAERERRRERIVTVSLATVGAFIGSALANALAQRRKK